MIFVTLGSQKFQFNRLLKKIDELVMSGYNEEIFAQIGYSDYKPLHYRYKEFLDREEFMRYQEIADVVITHGGTGAIIGAIKKGKKVIAIPRLAKYGEHVDDHQIQLIKQFTNQNLIIGLCDCEQLKNALKEINEIEFTVYESNTQKYIDAIEEFIEAL